MKFILLMSLIFSVSASAQTTPLFEVTVQHGHKISTFKLTNEGSKYFLAKKVGESSGKKEVSKKFNEESKQIFLGFKNLTSDNPNSCFRQTIEINGYDIKKVACLNKKSEIAEKLIALSNTLLAY